MKKLYTVLIVTFILSTLFGIILAYEYMKFIMSMVNNPDFVNLAKNGETLDPTMAQDLVKSLLTPTFGISLAITSIAGLINIIVGIIIVAQNKIMSSGNKVLWILGFLFLNFITNILFIAMKKSKNLLGETNNPIDTNSNDQLFQNHPNF